MDPSRLKVAELKVELKKRGLSLIGSKTDLVARLKNRLQAEERGEVNVMVKPQEQKKQKDDKKEVGGSVLAAVMSDDVPGNFENAGGDDGSGGKNTSSKPTKQSRLAQTMKRCHNVDDDDVMLCKSEELDAAEMSRLVEKQTQETKVFSGVVKSFSYKTGYGFIVPDGTRQDLFVHSSQISSDVSKSQTRGMLPGTEVEFLMSKNEFGKYIAIQVTDPDGKPLTHVPQPKTKKESNDKDEDQELDQEQKKMEEQAAIVEGLAKTTAKAMSVISSWFKRDHCKRHKEPEKAITNLSPAEYQLFQQKDKIYKGQCKWFNRGYGYVSVEGDGTEFFVHSSEIKGENGHKTLGASQEVEFKLAIAEDNHLIAVNLTGPKGVPVPRPAIKMELCRKNEVDGGLFNKLHRGSILWFDFNKRYGFITPEGDKENYFVHASEIYTRNYRNLAGQNCEFRITQLRDGRLVAVRVTGQNGVILKVWKKKQGNKSKNDEKKTKGEAEVGKEDNKEEVIATTTAPVTAMSIKHASMLKKNKPSILSCEKCNKTFCTEFDQKAHYASNKHLGIKKAKRWGGGRRKDKSDGTIGPKKPGGNVLKLRCELCNVGFTGEAQEKMHLEGKKHAQKLREKENPRPKGYGFWRGKRRMGTSDAAAAKRRAAVQTAQTQAYQQAAAAAAVAAAVAYDPYGMPAQSQHTTYTTAAASSTYTQPTASNSYSASKVPKQQTWYGSTPAQYAATYSAYGTAASTTSPATTSSYSYPTQSANQHTGQSGAHSGVYQTGVQAASQSVQQQSQQIQAQQVQPTSQNYQATSSQRPTYDPYQQQYNPTYPGHSY